MGKLIKVIAIGCRACYTIAMGISRDQFHDNTTGRKRMEKTIKELVKDLMSDGLFRTNAEAKAFVIAKRREQSGKAFISKSTPTIDTASIQSIQSSQTTPPITGTKSVYTKTCPNCKKEFRTARRNKIYCTQKCNFDAWDKRNPRQRTPKPNT
jgi:hypothetical protein